MQNQNSKEEITIEAELPVALEELAIYTLTKKGENKEKIVAVLDENPSRAEKAMRRIARENISAQKAKVQLEDLEFDYMDSARLWHGAAYFKAKLKGKEEELKKIAGENYEIFFYEWKEHTNSTLAT